MANVTLYDEYGRCLHCGFWHKPDTPAEQACAQHEVRGHCMCAFNRAFFPATKPREASDGV